MLTSLECPVDLIGIADTEDRYILPLHIRNDRKSLHGTDSRRDLTGPPEEYSVLSLKKIACHVIRRFAVAVDIGPELGASYEISLELK